MIIYDKDGKIQCINKLDFVNDKSYYMSIIQKKFSMTRTVEPEKEYPIEDKLIRLVMGSNN